ncbi:MAG: 3-oxoacyl-[acyl-carrier-protein] synthase III C-terminal domain-containing protein [Planctomycetota bacterium]
MKIITTAIAKAPYRYSIDQILPKIEEWLQDQSESLRKRVLWLFRNAQIQNRSSVLPIENLFQKMSFEEKNNHYIKVATDLAEEALKKALTQAKIDPESIDYLITTSCTGFMIPSVDAYLVNRLGLKQQIERLPVTEMGCAGGTAALIYASHYLRAYPNRKVAIVAVEAPTLTLQLEDYSMENFVSSAIFADGAACVILGNTEEVAPQILDTQMYHFPNCTHLMGFYLQNSGLKIILDRDVPQEIQSHFPSVLFPFIEKNHLTIDKINHFIFHPGGKKIISIVEDLLGKYGKNIDLSKQVLADNGNMSSATVLYVLARFLEKPIPKDDYGLMLAFGPGFTAQTLLLQWK